MKPVLELIDEQKWLENTAEKIQPVILNSFKTLGKIGSKIKNFLHGKWLGHPVHPMITDIPLGAWTTAAVLDVIELSDNKYYKHGADAAIAIGLVGAGGSAITGLTDWTGTTDIERKTGLLHGILNVSATSLYIISLLLRKNRNSRKTAIAISMLGYGVTVVSAYLGGTLVFNKQLGVNHTAVPEGYPENFVPVLAENDLKENQMKCVRAEKVDVLLVRKDNKIFAIANTCSHLGGPLSEGEIVNDCCVKCPWHNSVFSLEDGRVVNGPATQPQPTFEVQTKNGQIEVKLKDGWV